MRLYSETHEAEVPCKHGTLTVTRLAPTMVTITEVRNGTMSRSVQPATQVFTGLSDREARNEFWANMSDRKTRTCWVDVNCGCQRWHGYKGIGDVRKALKKCGFTPRQIVAIVSEM